MSSATGTRSHPADGRDPAAGSAIGSAALRRVDAHPLLVTLLLGLAGFLLAGNWTDTPADLTLFANAGGALIRGDLIGTFADPAVQTGPVTALFMFLLRGATAWTGPVAAPAQVLVLCLINAGCLVTALRVSLTRGGSVRAAALLVVGLLAVALGALSTTDAHPTHAVIALLWFLAVRAARRGRADVVGLVIGAACGLDTWGVLGAGAMLALPSVRLMARSAIVAGLAAGAFWLPFLAAGGAHLFQMRWTPVPESVPSLFFGMTPVPWSYRLAQGLVCLLAGASVAWWLRHSDDAAWVLPAAVVAVRIVLDPVWFEYYGVPVILMLLVGAATMVTRARAYPRSWPDVTASVQTAVRHPLLVVSSPLAWVSLALLLPPVTTLLDRPLSAFGPSIVCLGVLTAVLRGRTESPLPGRS
ncbi:MAG: hypothetical protein ABJA93_13890 [Sporichthyaceae bacterium]